ncbi:hypothetical protein GF362_02640 [Candidatus Dojkabacteria bacterium]|nr:hypothetical protein [Candidatus Dojkabacteria bacterium]
MKRNLRYSRENTKLEFKGLPKKLLLMILWLSVIFIIIQFAKLATVGRLGVQISEIKNEQEEYELKNELLRSEISELLANSNMEAELETDGNLEIKDIRVISVLEEDTDEELLAQR